MALPAPWTSRTVFSPIGSTPATSLTRDLAPEHDAQILTLGNGDPRNILYTVHSDTTVGDCFRKMDVTCVDHEPVIFARNTILLTMIADGVNASIIWDVFYHFYLDNAALDILISHCQSLLAVSADQMQWENSRYSYIKFGTEHTFTEVRCCWEQYVGISNLPTEEHDDLLQSFKLGMRSVLQSRETSSYIAARASAPFIHEMENLGARYWREFWTTGITFGDRSRGTRMVHINPIFVRCIDGGEFSVHYSTNPILSFHLGPLLASSRSSLTTGQLTKYALSQFHGWCGSFESRILSPHPNLVIRLILGDALAVCHALSYCGKEGITDTGIFAFRWGGSEIQLHEPSYAEEATSRAPTTFTIIDTSNLVDHIGLVNLLVATVPLLQRLPFSSIYTHPLLPSTFPGQSYAALAATAFGNIPTLSILLGLAPSPHLSSFTALSDTHEPIANFQGKLQTRQTISWKVPFLSPDPLTDTSSPPQALVIQPISLYKFLTRFYRNMFNEENVETAPEEFVERRPFISYTQASFVAFIVAIRSRVETNWKYVLNTFLNKIKADKLTTQGPNNYQELCYQLHRRGVHVVETFTPRYIRSIKHSHSQLRTWAQVPPLVTVILKVPRENLQPLMKYWWDDGAKPFLQCETMGPTFHDCYPSVRLVYGELDVANDPCPSIVIYEDPEGPNGKSSLLAIFQIPTCTILSSPPDSTFVALSIRGAPVTNHLLTSIFGEKRHIYSTNMLDTESLYFLPKYPGIRDLMTPFRWTPMSPVVGPKITSLNFSNSGKSVSSVVIRHDIKDPVAVESLSNNAAVTTLQISDCEFLVSYKGYEETFTAPFPVWFEEVKTKIGRKSHYIELEIPILSKFEHPNDVSLHPFPTASQKHAYNLLNLHYVDLNHLSPMTFVRNNQSLSWMQQFSRRMHSHAEALFQQGEDPEQPAPLPTLKDNLGKILSSSIGLNDLDSPIYNVYVWFDSQDEEFYVIILVNGIVFDPVSLTMVADACVIPIEPHDRKMIFMIPSCQTIQTNTTRQATILWRRLIAAAAERCRTWSHGPNCEYIGRGLPPKIDGLSNPLCSCGRGKNLGALENNHAWKQFASRATRVALPPLFVYNFLEEQFVDDDTGDDLDLNELDPSRCGSCKGPGKPDLSFCNACKVMKYCSRDCQKSHWKVHKKECAAMKESLKLEKLGPSMTS